MARIVTVYTSHQCEWDPRDMSGVRWHRISEALARLGHDVDIATNEPRWQTDGTPVQMCERLRRVPLARVRWYRYDVIKTLFHRGFLTLQKAGGAHHPFIISKLGSVVGPEDMPGIYFYGETRRKLFEVQKRIHKRSRYITLLSKPAIELWTRAHGWRTGFLLVPGAVDETIPTDSLDPYASLNITGRVCIFSGNIYNADSQPEANQTLVRKLNELGRLLEGSGVRLCFQGLGDTSKLDPQCVTDLGSCSYPQTWKYLQHASVGVVISAGPFMHNNESSKIYHYLRAGLPVVSEQGFPNDYLVAESGLGFLVRNGDMGALAAKVVEAAGADWDRSSAIDYIRQNHTWGCRVRVYNTVIPLALKSSWARRSRNRFWEIIDALGARAQQKFPRFHA